jgi:hypothetical protein
MLIAVNAPHFYAGVIVEDGVVVRAAPILKWCVGWQRDRLALYFKRKGWKAIIIESD